MGRGSERNSPFLPGAFHNFPVSSLLSHGLRRQEVSVPKRQLLAQVPNKRVDNERSDVLPRILQVSKERRWTIFPTKTSLTWTSPRRKAGP